MAASRRCNTPSGKTDSLGNSSTVDTSEKSPPALTDPRAKLLIEFPFPCANCDAPVSDASVYCKQLCRDEAKYVRYFRRKIMEGALVDPEVQEALRFRLAHILSGGYDAVGRNLSAQARRAVFQRDKGKCLNCGQPGSEIDHIYGDRNQLWNLQLLCDECHNVKTRASLQPITRAEHPESYAKAEALQERALAEEPLRLCDSEDEWNALWRSVQTARKVRSRRRVLAP